MLFLLFNDCDIFKVSKRLLLLKKLDGYPIIREEDDQDEDDKEGAEGDSDDSDQ